MRIKRQLGGLASAGATIGSTFGSKKPMHSLVFALLGLGGDFLCIAFCGKYMEHYRYL